MLIKQCRPYHSPRFFALDLEFIKYSRKVYARSLALVPFARAPPPPDPCATPSNLPCSSGGAGGGSDHRPEPSLPTRTLFSGTPTVLELCPEEVMRLAEVLPCGHLLFDRMRQSFIQGAALDQLAAPHHEEARSALASVLAIRRITKKQRTAAMKKDKQAVAAAIKAGVEGAERTASVAEGEGGEEAEYDEVVDDYPELELDLAGVPTSGSSVAATGLNVTHTAEELLVSGLQARVATTYRVRGIDPHSIPNVRVFDRDALELLHAAPVESRDFAEAARNITGLHVYEKGKRGLKPLALLARHSPALLQAMLRHSFDTPAAWYAWLEQCASAVEADLIAVRNAHRSNPTLRYYEFPTMKELAAEVHALWSQDVMRAAKAVDDARPAGVSKVYTYGNRDAPVLENTLTLAYGTVPMLDVDKPGARFASSKRIRAAPASALLLASPKMARLADVTQHPFFLARGYRSKTDAPLSLKAALAKAALTDAAAAELAATPSAHDPIWDAQALACVCTATDIVRSPKKATAPSPSPA